MSARTTTLRMRADVAADMDEANRYSVSAREALAHANVQGAAGSLARATALASLATFYAVRATWTSEPTNEED